MLRNHGLLTVGGVGPRRVLAHVHLRVSLHDPAARAGQRRSELIPIDQKIIAGAQMMAKQVTRSAGGALAWPGLLRKLDRIDRSYPELTPHP